MSNMILHSEGFGNDMYIDKAGYDYIGGWYVEVIEYTYGFIKKSIVTHISDKGKYGQICTFRIPVAKDYNIESGKLSGDDIDYMKNLVMTEMKDVKSVEYYLINTTKVSDVSKLKVNKKRSKEMPIIHKLDNEEGEYDNLYFISYRCNNANHDDIIISANTDMTVVKSLVDKNRKFIVLVLKGRVGEVDIVTKTTTVIKPDNSIYNGIRGVSMVDEEAKTIIANRLINFRIADDRIIPSNQYVSKETSDNNISSTEFWDSVDNEDDSKVVGEIKSDDGIVIKTSPEQIVFKNRF